MSRSEKDRRRELKQQVRTAEQLAARRRLGLTPGELVDLHEHLHSRLDGAACDNSLRFTDEWAQRSGRSITGLATVVKEFGGFCDCEVVANVTLDKFGWPEPE